MISKKHYKQQFIKDLAEEAYIDLQKAKEHLKEMTSEINEMLQGMEVCLADVESSISAIRNKDTVEKCYEMEKEMNGYPAKSKRTKKGKKK